MLIEATLQTALRQHRWNDALSNLDRLHNAKAIDQPTYKHHKMAIYIALADEQTNNKDQYRWLKKAYTIDQSFAPLILRLYRHYSDIGTPAQIKSILKKAWKQRPHPDLAACWAQIIPTKIQKNTDLLRL